MSQDLNEGREESGVHVLGGMVPGGEDRESARSWAKEAEAR